MRKISPIIVIVIVIVALASFYGGMKYAERQKTGTAQNAFRNLQNLSSGDRQARMQEMGGAIGGRRTGQGAGADFASGEIIAQDEKTITIKLRDSGSRIILFSNSVPVLKSAKGSIGDLKAGEQITVTGTGNPDGSLTAQSIQIRPETNTTP